MTAVLGIELPSNWRAGRLKNSTSFLNRGTAPDYVDEGPVRAISQAANQSGGLDWSKARFHAAAGDVRKVRGYLLPQDILINSTGTGTLGRIGFFEASPDHLPCMADGHVTVARALQSELWPKFAYYWLLSSPFQELIEAALAIGATNQIELSRERLGDAPVPLPPLPDQRRIADFLDAEIDRVDRLSSCTVRQLLLIDERLRELMRLTTTSGRGRINRLTGVPWMPEVREDWRLERASRLFTVGSGTTPPSEDAEYYADGDQYWVTSADIRDSVILDTTNKVTDVAISNIPALVVHPPGSLLVAMYGAGATKGRVGLLAIPAAVNQACCVLSGDRPMLPEFAFFWFRAHKQGIVQLATGAGQPNLSAELIKSLMVPVPPLSIQHALVRNLRAEEISAQRMASMLRDRLRLVAERRQALITAAVTGQIDVSTAKWVEVS